MVISWPAERHEIHCYLNRASNLRHSAGSACSDTSVHDISAGISILVRLFCEATATAPRDKMNAYGRLLVAGCVLARLGVKVH